MSGASMNQIKARMSGVRSTMQITRAMELVATFKLSRARERAQNADAFCRGFERSMARLLAGGADQKDSPWCQSHGGQVLYVVISGDRGLAGSFNSGVLRLLQSLREQDSVVLPWGKKAMDAYAHDCGILTQGVSPAAELEMSDCMSTARQICRDFLDGKYSRVELIYNR